MIEFKTGKVFLFCVCLISIVSGIPDNAIDFTATDVNGKQHNLFTYLNSGKYVLLDFVTTD